MRNLSTAPKRYVRYQGMRHPRDLGDDAIELFLSDLATNRNVSASTQNQALAALLFMYKEVLGRPSEHLSFTRARSSRHLPVVLSRREVDGVLQCLSGKYRLMGYFLYGSGLRQKECLALRVTNVDVDSSQVVVRDGKGAKDRVTMLPKAVEPLLMRQLLQVRAVLEFDIADGRSGVSLPAALARKYPNARLEWAWQYVFPASRYAKEPRTERQFRHHARATFAQMSLNFKL